MEEKTMSYVMMGNAPVRLHKGCPLFHRKGNSKERGEFQYYADMLVGPLDPQGRRPGRYADRTRLIMFFPERRETVLVSEVSFVDTYPRPIAAEILSGFSMRDERLGDLPYPIELWPGDQIRDTGRNQGWFTVESVSFNEYGNPLYVAWNEERSVELTRHYGPDGCMCQHGNVYHLYHDPLKLSFGSDEEELAFWNQTGIVGHMGARRKAIERFLSGEHHLLGKVDFLVRHDGEIEWRQLHDIFAEHRPRVRALTERVFAKELAEARAVQATA